MILIDHCVFFANIFVKTKKFAKSCLPVHMGPRSNLLRRKKWSKISCTVSLRDIIRQFFRFGQLMKLQNVQVFPWKVALLVGQGEMLYIVGREQKTFPQHIHQRKEILLQESISPGPERERRKTPLFKRMDMDSFRGELIEIYSSKWLDIH